MAGIGLKDIVAASWLGGADAAKGSASAPATTAQSAPSPSLSMQISSGAQQPLSSGIGAAPPAGSGFDASSITSGDSKAG